MKKISLQLLADTVNSNRKTLKISQADLAEKTGINRALISKLENKEFTPSIEQLEMLGEVLGFDPTDMFVDTATTEPIIIDKQYKIAVAGTG